MEVTQPTIDISYAVQGVVPIECTNHLLDLWRIRWDFKQVKDEEHPNVELVSFKECQLDHKPTMDEVKAIIEANSDQVLHDWEEYASALQQEE